MGYDFHITRKDFWADEDGPAISFSEWVSYVDSDGEIEQDPDNPGAENWVVTLPEGAWPLWWCNSGEVSTKNPEPYLIAKMIRIAATLGARVQGDDGEIYGNNSR